MELIKLKKIAEVITGYPFKGEKYSNHGIRTVRGENVTEGRLRWDTIKCWDEYFEKEDKYLLKENDVVIGMDGSKVGKNKARIVKSDLPLLLAQRVACLRAFDKNDQLFLYYLINNPRFEEYVFKTQTGSSVPHISKTQIENFEVPKIDFKIQQKIAKVLSNLDAKIELNNKINAELEAMAKTLYDYWFVQFDFPFVTSSGVEKPYKSSGGKMVYNEELKREIPEGWEVKELDWYINNDKSGDWGKENEEGNYTQRVYCVRGADINGLNGKGELKTPERYILEKNLFKTLDPHDLIVEISGGSPTQSTGRLAYITEQTLERFDAPIICSNFCKAVTLKEDKYFFNFVMEWNTIYDAGVLFGFEGKTSGIKNLLFDSFVTSYKTVVPPIELAEKFYDFMKPIQIKKEKNLKENQKLASLRDWLLPMLMNGQVRVGDVEEQLGMVAESGVGYKKVSKKKPKIVVLKPTNVEIYKRTLLAAEIVYKLHNEFTLGHLKLQKLLYLCQETNNMSLPMNFLKQAMGPYDNRLMRSLDKQFEEKKWFKFQKSEFPKYKPLGSVGSHKVDYLKYFEVDKSKINYLIETFRKFKSHDIEAVATLYACWKEAIENKELVNLELILNKFYNWSEEKEKFKPNELKRHLNWMKNKGIYPR